MEDKTLIEESNEKNKERYFLSPKIKINSTLDEILFFNRRKKATEAALTKNYNLAISYDNVTEEYIYQYLLLNKDKLNFSELENKTLALGLSKEHFETLGLKMEYFDFKKMFYQFIELLKTNIPNANRTTIGQNLISLYLNDELLLNQPLSFKNNKNLMYYSFLNFLLPSSKDSLKRYESILTKHNNVCILGPFLAKIEELTDVQIWNILFYTLSITEEKFVLALKEKLSEKKIEKEFSIFHNFEEIKCEIKDNILYGYNNGKEFIKIPNINIFDFKLIKNLIETVPIKINETKEIYDNFDLLNCIKIEFLNSNNYYTPHLTILKKIIKDILTSKAIDEFIDNFTDHESVLNPFKNENYYNILWNEYIHFALFKKEEFQAETFRVYHKIFFNALPIIDFYSLDISLTRLFNYSLFIIISVHELLGHLEKMILYYYFKKIKVKSEEFKDIEFDENFFDDLDEEMEFLKREFQGENYISMKNKDIKTNENENNEKKALILKLVNFSLQKLNNLDMVKILFKYNEENKEEDLLDFNEKMNSLINESKTNIIEPKEINNIIKIIRTLLGKEKLIDSDLKEGGYNVEKIIYGSEIFEDLNHPSINKALYILNSNNYISINNMRKVSTMFMSFRFAKQNKKDYLNSSNYSVELKSILKDLNLTDEFLENQDKVLFSTMYSDLLNYAINGKKYKMKRYYRRKSCIPSHA